MGTAQHDEVVPPLLPAGHRRDRVSCSGSVMGNGVSVQARAARFWELRCGPRPEWWLWSTGQAPERPSPGAVHWCAERLQETLTNPEASHCLQTCIPGAGLDSASGDRVGGGVWAQGSAGLPEAQPGAHPHLWAVLGARCCLGPQPERACWPFASFSFIPVCLCVHTHVHTHT